MPKAKLSRVNNKSLIASDLQAMLRDWDINPNGLSVAITIESGHDYWWFLEYGTGKYHKAPSGKEREMLPPPPSAVGKRSKRGPYPITPKKRKMLRFVNRRSHNVPVEGDLNGALTFSKGVIHPGVPAQGFIRNAMKRMDLRLLRRLSELDEEDTLPTRQEVVEILNEEIQYMLDDIQYSIPESSDFFAADPLLDPNDALNLDLEDELTVKSHLRDAFDVRLAR